LVSAPVLSDREAQGQTLPREFHLVLIDNGRMRVREDAELREALYCIRCSACLNSCANFQAVGGHAFGGETYSGGIGGSWEAATRGPEHSQFSELCTGCSRCVPQCPVKIDVPWLNTVLRSRAIEREASPAALAAATLGGTPASEPASLEKLFFGHYDAFAERAARAPWLWNWLGQLSPARAAMEKLFGLDRRRRLPPFAARTLVEAARGQNSKGVKSSAGKSRTRALLFADVFTNCAWPQRGLATLQVLRALDIDAEVSEVSADGRAAYSQGLLSTAAAQARKTAALLERHIDDGRDVIVVEPSVLAMFRLDYKHVLGGESATTLEKLRAHTFDPGEYIWKIMKRDGLDPARFFSASESPRGRRLFCHSHCQQKTIGADRCTDDVLRSAGFDVATSRVECCGMAGSFGYKKDFYDLSMAVGLDLFAQVLATEADEGRILVASGTSCQEQLRAGLDREVFHPMEILAETLAEQP
jgi:Fe-S oxidoreductase